MRPKYKVTGCARFFVFFLIFIPVVYFGAAYFRGEDGMQELRDFYHKMTGRLSSSTDKNDRDTYRIEDLREELNKAREEIRELKETIREKEKEIERLKTGGQ